MKRRKEPMAARKKRAKKKAKKQAKIKPMPIRWQQIIDLMPAHKWQITPAALALGYAPKYLESRMLGVLKRDARFCSALAEKKAEWEKKHRSTADKVMDEIKKIAFANAEDYATVDEDGEVQLIPFSRISRDHKAAISRIRTRRTTRTDKDGEVTETVQTELDRYNKLTACQEILDRIQGKARQAVDVRGVVLNRELSDEEMARVIQEPKRTGCEDAIAH